MSYSLEIMQQEFDIVLTGIRWQGKASYREGKCLYRGPDDCRCGVGWLIPDDKFDPSMDNTVNDESSVFGERFQRRFHLEEEMPSGVYFYKDLQNAHDSSCSPGITSDQFMVGFESRMEDLAQRYKLVYMPPRGTGGGSFISVGFSNDGP